MSCSAVILLEGELRKAYEDFVLGKGSLSRTQLEQLKKVTHLPDDFMSGDNDARFKKITSVDLSMFVSVVQIGYCFMFLCSALTSADLSALTSLSIIGSSFLYDCSAMASVTLPSASKITKIEDWFLGNCSSLTAINNMQALSNVTEIDQSFLNGCSSLENVDLRPLSNLKSVSVAFLYNCPKLTKKEHLDQVDLSPLLHLSDNDIEVYEHYEGDDEGENAEGNNNLKVALARVRSGGANRPTLAASSSSTAASQSSSACENCKKLEADLTSLNDENTRQLEKLRDQANLLQDLKQKQESSSGVTSASGGGNNDNAAVLAERCKSLEAMLAEARQDKQKAEERAEKLMAKLLG